MKQPLLAVVLAVASTFPAYSGVVLSTSPSRIVGHPNSETLSDLVSANPNYIEGRELYHPSGLVLDTSTAPPILYVADTANNRVLAWKNATGFSNGDPADLVIGQPSKYSTVLQGPAGTYSTGLYAPTGLAISNGNLYVADSGNNRILRYPKPFQQTSVFPDLVIGQANYTSRALNLTGSTTNLNAQGLYLASSSTIYSAGLALDSAGNLWVTDAGNARVLRFKAGDLAMTNPSLPLSADLELGQPDFTSTSSALNVNNTAQRVITTQFTIPSALAFDSAGRLYVSESDSTAALSRVMVFVPGSGGFFSGQGASRIMGVQSSDVPFTSQAQVNATIMYQPGEVFFFSTGMGVVDSGSNRILIFDNYDAWPAASTKFSPQARAVVGQTDFSVRNANGGTSSTYVPPPTSAAFYAPTVAAYYNGELYVTDSYNNRVLVLQESGTAFYASTPRVLGQERTDTGGINLVEAGGFDFSSVSSSGTSYDSGVAVDTSGDTPHLWVADTYNHRVLGFKDARTLKAGAKADIVIGQPDAQTSLCNYPYGDPDKPSESSLCMPTGVLVDKSGNLYVADSYNGRVLRFPVPFTRNETMELADLVLGQKDFFTKITDPSTTTMSRPYGLAFADVNGLLVSDVAHNRVLFFPFSSGGDFTGGIDNGKAATKVFGQPDFSTITSGSTSTKLSAPHHVAADSEARPYIADTGNNRIVIFDQILNNPSAGATAAFTVSGVNVPRGVLVSPTTGEMWVSDTSSNVVRKYPAYPTLVLSADPTAYVIAPTPLAMGMDAYGDLYVADATNRVAIYYPGLSALNGANYLTGRALAPNTITSIWPNGGSFGSTSDSYTTAPMKTVLAGVQVTVAGKAAPVFYASPSQINFVMPWSAPTSGTADVVVTEVSTGRILAASPVSMASVSPGIFSIDLASGACGSGTSKTLCQAAVINSDGTANSASNPAARGSWVSIYATGQGFVDSPPADGGNPSTLITTVVNPKVVIGACDVSDSACTGESVTSVASAISPQFPGVWQINARIPMVTVPGTQTLVALTMKSVPSQDATVYRLTIAVKQ